MATDKLEPYTSKEINFDWLLGWQGVANGYKNLGNDVKWIFAQENEVYGIKTLSQPEQFVALEKHEIRDLYAKTIQFSNKSAFFCTSRNEPLTNFLFKIKGLTTLKDYQVSKLLHQDIVFSREKNSFRGPIEVREKSSRKTSFVVAYQKKDYELICRQKDDKGKVVDSIRIDTSIRRAATISEEMLLKIINNQIDDIWFCNNNGARINPLEIPRTQKEEEIWWDKVHKKTIRHKKEGICYRLNYCGNGEMRGINEVGKKTPPYYIDTQQVLRAYYGHSDYWEFVDDEGNVITNFVED